MTARPLAVRVEALAKRFGRLRALEGVDLEVPVGATVGLVGANGAGKTTLVKCLLDLCAPDAGAISIYGVSPARSAARARVAYLPERFVPPHFLRGREFLAYACALGGAKFQRAEAERLLAALELAPGAIDQPVRALSKGMTQKLGLAAVFLVPRELLVLDEPMSGLDPASRLAAKRLLGERRRDGGTVLFTSHVLADIEELCDEVVVLERGQVRFRGTPRELCARTGQTSLERAYLRCIRADHGPER